PLGSRLKAMVLLWDSHDNGAPYAPHPAFAERTRSAVYFGSPHEESALPMKPSLEIRWSNASKWRVPPRCDLRERPNSYENKQAGFCLAVAIPPAPSNQP